MKVNELCAVPRLSSLGAAVQIGRERSGSKIRCSGYLGADLLERGDWTVQKNQQKLLTSSVKGGAKHPRTGKLIFTAASTLVQPTRSAGETCQPSI